MKTRGSPTEHETARANFSKENGDGSESFKKRKADDKCAYIRCQKLGCLRRPQPRSQEHKVHPPEALLGHERRTELRPNGGDLGSFLLQDVHVVVLELGQGEICSKKGVTLWVILNPPTGKTDEE